ncbi:MAG TPA: ABC transporter permease, partial [Candidatus Pelethocola excrementipullorum]|nr:ABC transporter permease [Candidatus Pelethocola excrementipullorum]
MMLLILIGCILGLGIRFYGNLKTFSGTAGFYYKEDTITREQVQDFWNEASPETQREVRDIVLFRSKSGEAMSNLNLNRTIKGEVIEVAGNMNLIMPGSLMMGSFVSDIDDRGCVISRKTAEKLFSSYEVLGDVVRMENKNYYIRGILDVNYELCMVQGVRAATYPNIRVDAPRLPLSVMEQQLAGILPAEYDKISEGDLYRGIGGILFWIPGWV